MLTGAPPAEGLPPQGPFVLRDRHGRTTPWYGVGQSLVLLPIDAAATVLGVRDARDRFLLVEYLFFPVVNGAVAVLACLVLGALGFPPRTAVPGALLLIGGSTLLWHFQNNQENPLQFLLVLTALYSVLQAGLGRPARWMLVAGGCLGLNVLIRLPNLIDAALVAGFAFALPALRPRRRLLAVLAAPVLGGLVVDRAYHFARFGHWTTTYMHELASAARQAGFAMPEGFPFSYPFWTGFLGPLVSLQRSVLIYDPLLLAGVILVIVRWKTVPSTLRALLGVSALGVVLTAAAYATYYNWTSASSWGDRFLTTWVWTLCLVAAAFLLDARAPRRWLVRSVVAAVLLLQATSVVLPSWVEEVQLGIEHRVPIDQPNPAPHYEAFVLGQRMENIMRLARGATDIHPPFPTLLRPPPAPGEPVRWAAYLGLIGCGLALAALIVSLTRWSRSSTGEPGPVGSPA